MKYNYTTNLKEATYEYEVFNDLKHRIYKGKDISICSMILGKDVPKDIEICGELIPTCGYIFRKTLTGKLLPARMTMHPKTEANIIKGSERYGELKISKEFSMPPCPPKTNFVIFEPSMAKTQQQRDALQQVLTLCEKGPDNYLGLIGLEEATENLLRLFPEVDYIGFDSDSEYDEKSESVRHTLKIYDKNCEEYSHIERAVCSDNKNLKIIAEQICKSRNITPKYLGGMWSYIHISQEGYTLGTHI